MKLSIIIVTYNNQDEINQCLLSCTQKINNLESEILVVDNSSSDKTVDIVKSYPQVKLIQNKTNRYYAAGCNQALNLALGKYILLLNPDTVIIDNTIQKMIDFLEQNSAIAVVGPRNFDQFGEPIISVYPQINVLDILQEGNLTYAISPYRPILSKLVYRYQFRNLCFFGIKPQAVGWVSGAGLLIRKKVADFLGPKDQRFFSYGEEADWLWNLDRANQKVYYLPSAEIVHLSATSVKKNWQILSYRIKSSYYNRIEFCQKHFPRWIFLLEFVIAWELILKIIYRALLTWDKDERKIRLKTYYDLVKWNSFRK